MWSFEGSAAWAVRSTGRVHRAAEAAVAGPLLTPPPPRRRCAQGRCRGLHPLRSRRPDADEVMPPGESHKTLSDKEKQTLRRWIEQGAKYQQHWSFEPLRRPDVPKPWAGVGQPVLSQAVKGRRHGDGASVTENRLNNAA